MATCERRGILPVLVSLCTALAAASGQDSPAPPAAAEIRRETLRTNHDPAGCPLPLAANWNVNNWGPDYQVEMVRKGHHVLPWIGHPNPRAQSPEYAEKYLAKNGRALRTWAAWKMPITIRGHNYAMGLTRGAYAALPPEKNPLTVRPDGSIWKRPSPLGPVEPWRRVGRSLTDTGLMKKIQQLYPDPPRVLFLSNNETRKLRWHELGQSKRYLDKYGKGKPPELKRRIVADGRIERFRALLGGMREALVSPAWRKNAIFVGYNAFGPPHYARWDGWKAYAHCTPERIAPQPLYWDGGSPSYYDNNWEKLKADYLAWSCQVEAMNLVFMQQEALKLNPRFWFEVSVWDGNQDRWTARRPKLPDSKPNQYRAKGQTWSPRRYQGSVQFGMWLLRPRVVREFRGSAQPREQYQACWDVILASVDRVWKNKTLRRFWRSGVLVPNRKHKHIWQADVLAKYKDVDRWFLLDTSLDAPRPWTNATRIPVFALARVLGEKPKRQWLLYAHAPLGKKQAVAITIPGFGPVTVNVSLGGSFYLIRQARPGATLVAGNGKRG